MSTGMEKKEIDNAADIFWSREPIMGHRGTKENPAIVPSYNTSRCVGLETEQVRGCTHATPHRPFLRTLARHRCRRETGTRRRRSNSGSRLSLLEERKSVERSGAGLPKPEPHAAPRAPMDRGLRRQAYLLFLTPPATLTALFSPPAPLLATPSFSCLRV